MSNKGKNAQKWREEYRREIEVKVPASEAWKLYGTLQLANIVREALPHLISKSTSYKATAPPEPSSTSFLLQEGGAVVVQGEVHGGEDERRVKETEVVEGGIWIWDLRFTGCGLRWWRRRETRRSASRDPVEYELKEEAAANAALVSIQPLVAVMQAAADYLTKNYNTTTNNV
ncbi:UNVERIFIED_CONTAM: hypothetical protein Sangu_0729100 [Sesamum angustifolium]|uniref:Uncharacterized protein n=1 Tax=Sesamum angustifolium TaxID=2727405 RepID=A0AAW2PU38_9LAMI